MGLDENEMLELEAFLRNRSYMEGWRFSKADKECFERFQVSPDSQKFPNVFRWYLHIASILGVRFLPYCVADKTPTGRKKSSNIFADHEEDERLESRAEMMNRIKQEIRESMKRESGQE
jgi:hypothetical protein